MFMTQTEAIEPYKARLSVLNQQYHDLQRKGAALMPDGVFAHMTINIVKGLADPNMPSKYRAARTFRRRVAATPRPRRG